MSHRQSGYLMGLERSTGHQLRWRSREQGGIRKAQAAAMIRDLLARSGDGDYADLDDTLHAADCTGCQLDRIS
jgi:hypothetical protein